MKQIFAVSLAALAISSVMAQTQNQGQSYSDTAQVLSAQPIYERNSVPRQECANETVTTDRRVPSQGYVDAGYQPHPAPTGERTMNTMGTGEALEQHLRAAKEFDCTGHAAHAQAAWESVARLAPHHPEAATRLAKFAMERGDPATALKLLQPAAVADPGHPTLPIDLAFAHLQLQQPLYAMAGLEAAVLNRPDHVEAWLLLGEIREVEGNARGALKAWYQAVTRAQQAGRWHGPATTPAHLLDAVMHAISTVRDGRRELLFGSFDDIRQRFGASELRRVQRALTGYLGDWDATPPDKRQRPKFL